MGFLLACLSMIRFYHRLSFLVLGIREARGMISHIARWVPCFYQETYVGEFLESPTYYCSFKILKREEGRSKKSDGEVTLGIPRGNLTTWGCPMNTATKKVIFSRSWIWQVLKLKRPQDHDYCVLEVSSGPEEPMTLCEQSRGRELKQKVLR